MIKNFHDGTQIVHLKHEAKSFAADKKEQFEFVSCKAQLAHTQVYIEPWTMELTHLGLILNLYHE